MDHGEMLGPRLKSRRGSVKHGLAFFWHPWRDSVVGSAAQRTTGQYCKEQANPCARATVKGPRGINLVNLVLKCGPVQCRIQAVYRVKEGARRIGIVSMQR